MTVLDPLRPADLAAIKRGLGDGRTLAELLPACAGGRSVVGGFWRLVAAGPDLARWNDPGGWKRAWAGAADPLVAVGEDVFGNQLCLGAEGRLLLWGHEDGQVADLEADALAVLEAALTDGLGWLDAYRADGSYDLVWGRVAELPANRHWHWVQPLCLGGAVAWDNLAPLDRWQHLVGHGTLWTRLAGNTHA
jgi:hypothetical protein